MFTMTNFRVSQRILNRDAPTNHSIATDTEESVASTIDRLSRMQIGHTTGLFPYSQDARLTSQTLRSLPNTIPEVEEHADFMAQGFQREQGGERHVQRTHQLCTGGSVSNAIEVQGAAAVYLDDGELDIQSVASLRMHLHAQELPCVSSHITGSQRCQGPSVEPMS